MLSAIRSAGDSAQDTAGPLHSRGVLPVSAVCTSVAKGHRDMWCESRAVALRLLTPLTPSGRCYTAALTQRQDHPWQPPVLETQRQLQVVRDGLTKERTFKVRPECEEGASGAEI